MELTTESLHTVMPFGATLGMRLVSAAPDRVVGELDWDERLCSVGGALHGGVLMALADSVGGAVAFLNLPPGAGTSTIASSTSFLRAARAGTVTATGRLVHQGRTTIVVETELTDADGRPLTRTTQTQAVLAPRE